MLTNADVSCRMLSYAAGAEAVAVRCVERTFLASLTYADVC